MEITNDFENGTQPVKAWSHVISQKGSIISPLGGPSDRGDIGPAGDRKSVM